jgi:hypothetical protein
MFKRLRNYALSLEFEDVEKEQKSEEKKLLLSRM